MARPAGLEPATLGLAYPLQLSLPEVASVWGLDHLFTVSGVARMASTDPGDFITLPKGRTTGFLGIAISLTC